MFTINGSTGELTFNTAPDFEAPGDADTNNVYEVQVQVFDGTDTTVKSITVTVTDANNAPVITDESQRPGKSDQWRHRGRHG